MTDQLPDPMTARQIIDQLKSGTTPLDAAFYLDVGRERWYKGMQYYFEGAEYGESKVRFIRGRYGDGKTHLMAMARHFALRRGFAVSYASAEDTRLDKIEELYKKVCRNLQTQEVTGGLEFLLRSWKEGIGHETEQECERLRSAAGLDINFRIVVESYLRGQDPKRCDQLVLWLLGEPIKLPELDIRRHLKPGDSRDMMRSLSVFLRLVGCRGLLILLDELDRIQYLSKRSRENCYQVLRELMDNTDGHGGMQGTLFYCAAPVEMFTSPNGFQEYDALWSRLEPALQADQANRIDYRATIINLDGTPLDSAGLLALATKVRDIHSRGFSWDAAAAMPESKLQEIVDRTINQESYISKPRLLATAIATIADIEQQGQSYDIDTELNRSHFIAEQARIQRHHRKYEE